MKQELRAKLKMTVSMFLFGTIGIFVRSVVLPSTLIALVRGFVGMVFLLLVLAFRRSKLASAALRKNLLWLILSGVALGFNWILLFESYRYTSVAVSTLCYYMAPILVILVSPVFLKERLTGKKIVCVLTALIGMVCISGVIQSGMPSTGECKGILLGLAAAVLYASVVLLNKQIRCISAYNKTIFQLGISVVTLLPYCFVTVHMTDLNINGFSVLMLLLVGVVHTGVTYLLYFGSLEYISGQTAAIISYIDPVVAVLMSVLVLAEPISWTEGLGAVLILGAALISEVNFKRKQVEL